MTLLFLITTSIKKKLEAWQGKGILPTPPPSLLPPPPHQSCHTEGSFGLMRLLLILLPSCVYNLSSCACLPSLPPQPDMFPSQLLVLVLASWFFVFCPCPFSCLHACTHTHRHTHILCTRTLNTYTVTHYIKCTDLHIQPPPPTCNSAASLIAHAKRACARARGAPEESLTCGI